MSSQPGPARADDPAPASTWRDALWITGSGTLLGAALSGMFALKASARRERAQSMFSDSPELPGLLSEANQASALSLDFGIGAALFGVASVILLAGGPGMFAATSGSPHATALAPVIGPSTAGVYWRGNL